MNDEEKFGDELHGLVSEYVDKITVASIIGIMESMKYNLLKASEED